MNEPNYIIDRNQETLSSWPIYNQPMLLLHSVVLSLIGIIIDEGANDQGFYGLLNSSC